MAILSILGDVEYGIGYTPCNILILTSDNIATVMGVGYLNGRTEVTWANDSQFAQVSTTEGLITLQVSIVGANTSLISPQYGPISSTTLLTKPPASQTSSLALGTAYQNTFGYDVMLSVYVNVTSAFTASFLLGVGPTSSPTQQTIISGLTIAALGVIPVSIYLPANYYAKLNTSGTIAASIGGQIAMPV